MQKAILQLKTSQRIGIGRYDRVCTTSSQGQEVLVVRSSISEPCQASVLVMQSLRVASEEVLFFCTG